MIRALLSLVTLLASRLVLSAPLPYPGAGHNFHLGQTPAPPPHTVQESTKTNASIVFADDTSTPHLGDIAPNLVTEGCSPMRNKLGDEEDKEVSDLSLLQSMPGWQTFLDFIKNDLELPGM